MRTGILVGAVLGVLFAAPATAQHDADATLVGAPAPGFRLPVLETGDTVDLQTLEGKIIVLNFWASWCVYCREEHSVLARVARELRSRDVVVYGVLHADSRKNARAFLDRYGGGFPTLIPENAGVALKYDVLVGLPVTIVIDRQLRVSRVLIGPVKRRALMEAIAAAERGSASRGAGRDPPTLRRAGTVRGAGAPALTEAHGR